MKECGQTSFSTPSDFSEWKKKGVKRLPDPIHIKSGRSSTGRLRIELKFDPALYGAYRKWLPPEYKKIRGPSTPVSKGLRG
jgi:hypothetical protein